MSTTTIHDVAKEAGVSIATVSYVLNESKRVADDTRRRVLEAAERLGYRANIMARNLQASETRLLGYTWRPSPVGTFNPILDRFLQAIAEAAARHDYRILTFPSNSIQDERDTYRELMRIGQVDGFVLSNTNLHDQRVSLLLDAKFPFVAFGRSNPEWDFPWVDVDGSAGFDMAARHLIDLGHRRIACLAWPESSLTGQYRTDGYRAAMTRAGLNVNPEWIVRCGNFYTEAYEATRRLLALSPAIRPTAIVAMSDLMAMGAINAGWDAGLHIGPELSVVGFDDSPVARFFRPSLTSVHQPIGEVGERLATMLADLARNRPLAEPHVLLKPTLEVRESSAAPAG